MNTKHFAFLFFAAAFLIALSQYVEFGEWFTFSQLHHETFVVMFGFAGLLFLWRPWRKEHV